MLKNLLWVTGPEKYTGVATQRGPNAVPMAMDPVSKIYHQDAKPRSRYRCSIFRKRERDQGHLIPRYYGIV
jgi:hypothetical protein